ncbi:MAG TPA: alkaline phosphatase D family protein [Polyangiaceae bacterium]
MTSHIVRRDFLRITVVSALGVAAPNLGCGSDDPDAPGSRPRPLPPPPVSNDPNTLRVFPQGVASGDPSPNSVLLWTRVQPATAGDVSVHFEVATDLEFAHKVAEGDANAFVDADNTLRLKVENLKPFTGYYFRFTADGAQSDIGRTKTAPAADRDVPVKFAFASCQDYVGRYYHAWRALVEEAPDVDFVLHLGDYIYETDGDPAFQTPTEQRNVKLPDGLRLGENSYAARTLADYRHLYKTFRSDRDLQRAHQLFPFIVIWDDHEFGNDAWQDHTTHFSDLEGPEKVPEQRDAASRAWFEFQPADVIYDPEASYPDRIRIYRKLRYGKHVELFMTDQRYYRAEHLIPEGPTDGSVLKIVANSAIGSRIFLLKEGEGGLGFDPIEAAAKPTMLGADQKQWIIDGLTQSNATWKIWGSETQLSQMVADLSDPELGVADFLRQKFYLSTDQWDGYRSERAEILSAVANVENLLVVTGDIHAFYGSELHVDFDNPGSKPVGVEYVVGGISSQGVAPAAEGVLSSPELLPLGLVQLIARFDPLLKFGSPHYKFANSFVNGIGVCEISASAASVSFLIVSDVTKPEYGALTRVRMRTRAGTSRVEVLEG